MTTMMTMHPAKECFEDEEEVGPEVEDEAVTKEENKREKNTL